MRPFWKSEWTVRSALVAVGMFVVHAATPTHAIATSWLLSAVNSWRPKVPMAVFDVGEIHRRSERLTGDPAFHSKDLIPFLKRVAATNDRSCVPYVIAIDIAFVQGVEAVSIPGRHLDLLAYLNAPDGPGKGSYEERTGIRILLGVESVGPLNPRINELYPRLQHSWSSVIRTLQSGDAVASYREIDTLGYQAAVEYNRRRSPRGVNPIPLREITVNPPPGLEGRVNAQIMLNPSVFGEAARITRSIEPGNRTGPLDGATLEWLSERGKPRLWFIGEVKPREAEDVVYVVENGLLGQVTAYSAIYVHLATCDSLVYGSVQPLGHGYGLLLEVIIGTLWASLAAAARSRFRRPSQGWYRRSKEAFPGLGWYLTEPAAKLYLRRVSPEGTRVRKIPVRTRKIFGELVLIVLPALISLFFALKMGLLWVGFVMFFVWVFIEHYILDTAFGHAGPPEIS